MSLLILGFPIQSLILFGIAILLGYFFLSGFIWGAGYYPTPTKEIDSVVSLLELCPNSVFYDLGSGYGRMVISISRKYRIKSVGVEVDPVKSFWTNLMIRRKKLQNLVSVVRSNMFDVDLSNADGVFIFLSSEGKIMEKLRGKMFREMKPGSRVVSFVHKFKDWEPDKIVRNLTLYKIPDIGEKGSKQQSGNEI